jgi:hypothetical protein
LFDEPTLFRFSETAKCLETTKLGSSKFENRGAAQLSCVCQDTLGTSYMPQHLKTSKFNQIQHLTRVKFKSSFKPDLFLKGKEKEKETKTKGKEKENAHHRLVNSGSSRSPVQGGSGRGPGAQQNTCVS